MRSLGLKLVLAFLAVSLVGTMVIAIFVARITTTRFDQFITAQLIERSAERLSDYYQIQGSWEGVLRVWNPVLVGERRENIVPGMPRGAPAPDLRRAMLLVDHAGVVIIPTEEYPIGTTMPHAMIAKGTPISVNGEQVGTLIEVTGEFYRILRRDRFLGDFYRAVGLGTVGATVVALLLGVLLSRSLTRPLRELTAATRAMSSGDLAQQIPVRSRDELGELTRSFNQMSTDLARSQALRRQMTADIAHELRTPLSLILGHTEALSEGVLPPSPETFEIMYDEAQRLTRLVEDLRTLSLSDADELRLYRAPVAMGDLLARLATANRPRAEAQQIAVEIQAPPELPEVEADPDRIYQVFSNLLDNALRYSPQGGHITLSARVVSDELLVSVQDGGPGIAPEDLEGIFDRFYRSNKPRLDGGTGLGLSIARSLVEAHGGRIWAESTPGEGAVLTVALPLDVSSQ
ncbi:MAG: HAMP domain-containing protein [Anaerolineae bacterium]|nr:HAMP domain-containing protein [Anaerolineae bacterium]